MINSSWNYFIEPELKFASENNMHYLLILGIHAVAETWAEILFKDKTNTGFKTYLELYVDGNSDDQKLSKIAEILNDKRNIIAHQWLSCQGHWFGFDFDMKEGWREKDGITYVNPKVYFMCFYDNFPT